MLSVLSIRILEIFSRVFSPKSAKVAIFKVKFCIFFIEFIGLKWCFFYSFFVFWIKFIDNRREKWIWLDSQFKKKGKKDDFDYIADSQFKKKKVKKNNWCNRVTGNLNTICKKVYD